MHKKIVLLFVMATCLTNVFAQTQKGKFLLGAGTNLDFSSLNSQLTTESYTADEIKNNSFELSTRLGYFIANNFAAGIDIFHSNSIEKEDGDIYKSKTFAIGPFARIYFGKENIKPFIHTGFGFGNNKEEFDSSNIHYSDDSVKSKLTVYDAGGGVNFILSEKVALEVGISYGIANSKFKTHYNENATNKVKGISTDVGFSIHL